jgi:hypothetical protein
MQGQSDDTPIDVGADLFGRWLDDEQHGATEDGPVQAAAADPVAVDLQQRWEQAKAVLLKRWPKTAAPMVNELADQAEAAVAVGDLAALGGLEVSAGVLTALTAPLTDSGSKLARQAAGGVVAEAAGAGVSIGSPVGPGAERVRQHASAVARLIAAGYASGAAKVGLQLAGADPREVRDAVAEHLTELGTSENGLVGENIGSLLSAAQFAGRLAVLEQHPAAQYESVESLDKSVCKPCAETSGRVYKTLKQALADYPGSGQMRRCEGRSRCRGFVRPRW